MMRRLLALFAVAFLLIVPSASADGFDEVSLSIGEGETFSVDLTASDNLTLDVNVLYGFSGMSDLIIVTPTTVGVGTTSVSVHFAQLSEAEKDGIDADTYRARIDAEDNEGTSQATLYLYLDMSVPESILATIQSTIENMEGHLLVLDAAVIAAEESEAILSLGLEVESLEGDTNDVIQMLDAVMSNDDSLIEAMNNNTVRVVYLENAVTYLLGKPDGVSHVELFAAIAVTAVGCIVVPYIFRLFRSPHRKQDKAQPPTAEEMADRLRKSGGQRRSKSKPRKPPKPKAPPAPKPRKKPVKASDKPPQNTGTTKMADRLKGLK